MQRRAGLIDGFRAQKSFSASGALPSRRRPRSPRRTGVVLRLRRTPLDSTRLFSSPESRPNTGSTRRPPSRLLFVPVRVTSTNDRSDAVFVAHSVTGVVFRYAGISGRPALFRINSHRAAYHFCCRPSPATLRFDAKRRPRNDSAADVRGHVPLASSRSRPTGESEMWTDHVQWPYARDDIVYLVYRRPCVIAG